MSKLDQRREDMDLQSIVGNDAWEAVLRVASRMISDWQAEPVNGENEFQTLRMLHNRDGKVEGVKEFLARIQKPSQQ